MITSPTPVDMGEGTATTALPLFWIKNKIFYFAKTATPLDNGEVTMTTVVLPSSWYFDDGSDLDKNKLIFLTTTDIGEATMNDRHAFNETMFTDPSPTDVGEVNMTFPL